MKNCNASTVDETGETHYCAGATHDGPIHMDESGYQWGHEEQRLSDEDSIAASARAAGIKPS